MNRELQITGITPYVLRTAAYYASLGCGEYQPNGYAAFDKVVVRELLPWQAQPNPMESTLMLIVEFYQEGRRVKFVEFCLKPEGFGGDPVIRRII